jgi:hypothetical protein
MDNIQYDKNSNDTCIFCSHTYSIHYSNDIHGLGSIDIKDVRSEAPTSILLVEVSVLVRVIGLIKPIINLLFVNT